MGGGKQEEQLLSAGEGPTADGGAAVTLGARLGAWLWPGGGESTLTPSDAASAVSSDNPSSMAH